MPTIENLIIEHHPGNLDAPKVALTRTQFILVYIGIICAALMYSLDQTIVAPALHAMINDLGHTELVSWVGSAFMLCSGSTGILYGRLSDIFGRKPAYLTALVLFEVGSVVCATAQSMNMLIVGRAITGVGGGGIATLGVIIVSDIVSLKDRGKFQGLTGAIYGLSSMIGPVLGGYFTQNLNWRWCFWINLPVGCLTVLAITLFLKLPPVSGNLNDQISRVDYFGAFLILSSIGALLAPIQFGGSTWSWLSAPIISLFILSIALLVVFVHVEMHIAKEPIVPMKIFKERVVVGFLAMSVAIGAAMFPVIYYNSLFYQFVYGMDAIDAGASTLPSMVTFVAFSIVAGMVLSKTGSYNIFFVLGPIIWILSTVYTAFLTKDSSAFMKITSNLILGIGPGMVYSTRISGIQLNVDQTLVAVVSGCAVTMSVIGGAFGISITGTILNNVITTSSASDVELQNAVGVLGRMGINLDVSQFVELLTELDEVIGEANGERLALFTAAKSQLISRFTEAFKIGALAWIPYLIVLLGLLPLVWKRTGKKA
ncbi:UNVERIFIED_CONTAM: hypothetical protein HDU68_003307 [Siphonaria sp. JEL0065]|nr:hypothetical protein HDU68_003307 [Siphonaria sp. JEL0065]